MHIRGVRNVVQAVLVAIFCISMLVYVSTQRENEQQEIEQLMRDCGIVLEEYHIYLEGAEREYTFLFMADNHCSVNTGEMIDVWGITSDDRIAAFSNSYGINSSSQFECWMDIANRMNVDAVLLGGDTIDYLTKENVDFAMSNLDTLKMPYLYTMGNHDSYDALGRYSMPFNPDDELLVGLSKGENFECQVMEFEDFLVVSINDFASGAKAEVSQRALAEFKEIYNQKKPILLMLHVPITTSNTEQLRIDCRNIRGDDRLLGYDLDYEISDSTKEFYEMVLRDDTPVFAVLGGHIHFEHKDFLNDKITQLVSKQASEGYAYLVTVSNSH